jgi:hypothetical protein
MVTYNFLLFTALLPHSDKAREHKRRLNYALNRVCSDETAVDMDILLIIANSVF